VQAALLDQRDTARDYQNVMETALLTADPSMAAILAKLKEKGRNLQQVGAQMLRPPMARGKIVELSDDEQRQLTDAFMKARIAPDAVAARNRMIEANNLAMKALHASMEKMDPSVEPLLAQLAPARRGPNRLRERRKNLPNSPTPTPAVEQPTPSMQTEFTDPARIHFRAA